MSINTTNDRYNDYIGVLASEGEVFDHQGFSKQSVFINSQNEIQYIVKALSDDAPTRFYTGYKNVIIENRDIIFGNVDEYRLIDEERIENFKEAVENYVFLFTSRKEERNNQTHFKISKTALQMKQSILNENDCFFGLPVFSPEKVYKDWIANEGYKPLNRTYNTFEAFLNCIQESKLIGRVARYTPNETTKFVIWYDEKQCYAIGPVSSLDTTSQSNLTLKYDGALYKIDLSKYMDYIIYNEQFNPCIMHLSESAYYDILNDFANHNAEHVQYLFSKEESSLLNPIGTKPITNTENDVVISQKIVPVDNIESRKDDITFLQTFHRLCEERNLFYVPHDLTNFHTAIKTGNLVILSGLSGIGKSALVDVYAKALGIKEDDDRILTIPVRPSWNDDADLLGYVDLVHMVYRASDTGFVRMLVEASKEENSNKLYFICFDEMNLSRVEHYFSQFLSILEKPVGKRQLRLYDEQYRNTLYNSAKYPDVIELKDNIRFIGTVNIDESTYHFADKVLDRANVINLHILPFNDWNKQPYVQKRIDDWEFDDFKQICKLDDIPQKDIREFLWEFNKRLDVASVNFGIGPRIVKAVELYLNNLPEISDSIFTISRSEGIDLQVKQRILTKLRGSQEQLETLFNTDGNSLFALFDQYSHLSTFTESRKVLESKKKELNVYGYCI